MLPRRCGFPAERLAENLGVGPDKGQNQALLIGAHAGQRRLHQFRLGLRSLDGVDTPCEKLPMGTGCALLNQFYLLLPIHPQPLLNLLPFRGNPGDAAGDGVVLPVFLVGCFVQGILLFIRCLNCFPPCGHLMLQFLYFLLLLSCQDVFLNDALQGLHSGNCGKILRKHGGIVRRPCVGSPLHQFLDGLIQILLRPGSGHLTANLLSEGTGQPVQQFVEFVDVLLDFCPFRPDPGRPEDLGFLFGHPSNLLFRPLRLSSESPLLLGEGFNLIQQLLLLLCFILYQLLQLVRPPGELLLILLG